ncbi:exopolysaccharide biosynthesis polyprenyl glycosylphosphotransferase [Maribellus sp. YY47]|uniref:exopolysaccharide biosynthesis polyprenyl glycosylphosphotransferase n=1 Tax=Maribellus sp. YY47 TaxID=2929486 RepID=UPI0020007775|nr:exopolysaccharide biosynthesis polyprenyl glycosylphosphotransferase [Maribellus sp. YY47]MCK3685161.1 exopolysaccharide biosynthesis polyprenyl glycosylphosphotransferase [Maribellus sp. YY47]
MKSRETELLVLYLAIDLVLLNAALAIMAWLSLDISARDYRTMSIYVLHGNLAWIISYLIFSKKNLYLRDNIFNRLIRITKRQLVFYLVSAVIAFMFVPGPFFRTFFFEYTLLFYLGKVVFYWLFYYYLRQRRGSGNSTLNTAVIGHGETGDLLKRIIVSNPSLGYRFSGFISSNEISEEEEELGHPDKLEEIIDRHNLQMIFYTISLFSDENGELRGKKILKLCNQKGVRLRFVPKDQWCFKSSRNNLESIGDLLVLNPQEIPLDNVSFRIQKRLFDIAFSLMVILFIFSWLLPIVAIAIKLSSRGPVFFKQQRTGINNRTFYCYKFRSMKPSKEADTLQASADDDRITPIGHFMRKTNIDELPQFFNVLIGDMSVVGPRPHMLKHTEEYAELIDYYLVRHYVKPGISGWAQVKGYRGETKKLSAMQNRVNADMEYIRNWSFAWDLKIIWLTVFSKKAWNNAV